MNESRICIALDFKTKSDVENFLKQFEGESLYVKVGMELFYGEGIEIIKMIKEMCIRDRLYTNLYTWFIYEAYYGSYWFRNKDH